MPETLDSSHFPQMCCSRVCAEWPHRVLLCCLQVRLRPDERFGVVHFGTAEAVQSAIDALHGTKICGEKISVTRVDPLMSPHNSKRARMAPTQADHLLSPTF